jgi:hypothetical protein
VIFFILNQVGSNLKNFGWTGAMKLIAGGDESDSYVSGLATVEKQPDDLAVFLCTWFK